MELTLYQTEVLITLGINILMGLSVFVTFTTGQLSLGIDGFMALGDYASSVMTQVLKWDLTLAMIAGGLVSSAIGLGIAFPALRLRGIYLALVTLAFGEIIRVFFDNLNYTGGAVEYSCMTGTTLTMTYIYVALFLFFFWRLYSSRLGRAFGAVAQDDRVAEAMGINTTLIKVVAFAMSGFLAGVAGGLYAHDVTWIGPYQFSVHVSLLAVLMVILGGMGTFWGVVLGAGIFAVLPEVLRFTQSWQQAALGAFFVVVLIYRPHGLLTEGTVRFSFKRRANVGDPRFSAEDPASGT